MGIAAEKLIAQDEEPATLTADMAESKCCGKLSVVISFGLDTRSALIGFSFIGKLQF